MNSVKVNLGKTQMEKVKRAIMMKNGTTIRLSPSDFNGNTTMMLGPRNFKKFMNHKNKGVGVSLKISMNELKSNSMNGGFLQAILPILKEVATSEPVKAIGRTILDSITDIVSGKDSDVRRAQEANIQLDKTTRAEQSENMRLLDEINKKASEFKGAAKRTAVKLDRARLQTPEFAQQQMAMKGNGMAMGQRIVMGQGMNLKNMATVNFSAQGNPIAMRLSNMTGAGLLYAPGTMRRRMMGCGVGEVENPMNLTSQDKGVYGNQIRSGLNFSTVKEGRWSQSVPNSYAPSPSSSQIGLMSQKEIEGMKKGNGLLFGPNFVRQGGLLYSPNSQGM